MRAMRGSPSSISLPLLNSFCGSHFVARWLGSAIVIYLGLPLILTMTWPGQGGQLVRLAYLPMQKRLKIVSSTSSVTCGAEGGSAGPVNKT